jgi:hypothetical protein
VDLCSIHPSPKPKTRYHLDVEIFIDDETREVSVYDVFGFFSL